MAHLSVHLLGAFQVTLHGKPVTTFESVKTQALLAYLVLEPDRPHSRLKLAGLLWPDRPDAAARNNLRHTLYSLRDAVGDRDVAPSSSEASPFLMVTRETVQFNRASDCWVDVHTFRACVAEGVDQGALASLEEAVALYRGDFLDGFYVSESPVFEDWMVLMRDRLQRQAALALRHLVVETSGRGDYDAARRYGWRWVELEPWQEEAHQHLMRVLASGGRRAEALAQFEACRATLQEEFDVAPSEETVRLYELIRDERFVPEAPAPPRVPTAMPVGASPGRAGADRVGFVARERELAQLGRHLDAARGGRGHVVFVTGEAGYGKTALVQAFARAAQAADPQLAVLGGSCNAYTGVGDPYLPFREILEQAVGAGERAAAGSMGDGGDAIAVPPIAIQALLAHGRDLIDVFVPASTLGRWADTPEASQYAWTPALRDALARAAAQPPGIVVQEDLFAQVAAVVRAISQQVPLLLVIDDLQWADLGSTALLFHLGKRLAESRILITGAYRPEEVALGRGGERHPLTPVVHEFKRDWGDIEVDLHLAESRHFVEALLASVPNALGEPFRDTLFRQTGGHALFTVELLRGMQERGDLIQDVEGRWIEGPMLNWEILPSRVEAVIAERVDRLPASLAEMLRWASVEGEVFTAEVLAQAQGRDLQETIGALSGDLDRRHRLVRAEGVEQVVDQRLSHYRFRHFLFQRFLYNSLDEVERVHLHEQVGRALEGLCQGSADALTTAAPQLARHFEVAGAVADAVRYYELAGQRAIRMVAHREAIAHLDRALALLAQLPASPDRDRWEVGLRLAIVNPIMMLESWGAPSLVENYRRAETLADSLGATSDQLAVLGFVRMYYTVRAEHDRSVGSAERFLALAQSLGDPLQMALGHTHLGIALVFTGEWATALRHFQEMLTLFDRTAFLELGMVSTGGEPEVATLATLGYPYWYLGYPERSMTATRQALALAESAQDPMSLYFALAFKVRVHRWCGDVEGVEALIAPMERMWTDYHMPMAMGNVLQDRAWVLSGRGRPEEGIPLYQQALEIWAASGMANHLTEFYGVLAEMVGKAGQPDEGLAWIDKALGVMERTGERYHEAELYRLRGELRLQAGDYAAEAVVAAAADFDRATEVSRRQEARSLELRAAMSRFRLRRDRGTPEEAEAARQALADVYAWFTEGFDTRDLREARALLD